MRKGFEKVKKKIKTFSKNLKKSNVGLKSQMLTFLTIVKVDLSGPI